MNVKKLNNNEYCVLLKKGDDLIESINLFHKEYAKGNLCKLSGIGAITDVELGFAFYNKENLIDYTTKIYNEEYELLHLDGNVSLRDNESYAHIHLTMSDKDNLCHGGHLYQAKVSIVVEMFITVYGSVITRSDCKKVGLKALDI